MKRLARPILAFFIMLLCGFFGAFARAQTQSTSATSTQGIPLAQFIVAIRQKEKAQENSSGMRLAFQSFLADHHLSTESVRYSDFVLIRLLYEATRDAGFWNMHWSITDQPPNSDRIWGQWKTVRSPSFTKSTATAECDELSALYAFLVEHAGVKSVGLFWPSANHTVAVWVLQPSTGPVIRVVVPTSQIFLDETDSFDTKKFNPWHQKTIYEYTRRDVPDSFELPKPLADFFLQQVDDYAGASDTTLQRLRYVRDAVFAKAWTTEQAAHDADVRAASLAGGTKEDATALVRFASQMRLESQHK